MVKACNIIFYQIFSHYWAQDGIWRIRTACGVKDARNIHPIFNLLNYGIGIGTYSKGLDSKIHINI